jgi:hypothetical protein
MITWTGLESRSIGILMREQGTRHTKSRFNNLPEPHFFIDQLTSSGASVEKFQPAVNGQANRNFYANFPQAVYISNAEKQAHDDS